MKIRTKILGMENKSIKHQKLSQLSTLIGDNSSPRNNLSASPYSTIRKKYANLSKEEGVSVVSVSTAYCRAYDLYVMGKFVATLKHGRLVGVLRYVNNDDFNIVDIEILSNYITHGHTTQCGILKAQNKIDRIKQIGYSHDMCSVGGVTGHEIRKRLRK